jgi:hypothetical protein
MNIKSFRLTRLAGSLLLAVGLLVLLASWFAITPAQAQQPEISVTKQLGRSDPVVYVGQYLTFTIDIVNNSAFTVTTLPLTDDYNEAVLAYVDASVPPSNVDTGAGQIDWDDLTTSFGDLAPGQSITVIVGFIAEHPEPTVVNYAQVHDAIGSGGSLGDSDDTSQDGESVGGSAPLEKRIEEGVIPEVGLPLTFTIAITNDGYTTMTVVPLLEDYDPSFLQYSYAVPPPDTVDEINGELNWDDLTDYFGDVGAQETISLTAVFTALASIDGTMNQASVSAFQDWYGNDLAGGSDLVPIIIIDNQQQTATPAATATSDSGGDNGGNNNNNATATLQATATVTATATREMAAQMPETGIPPSSPIWPTLLLMGFVMLLPLFAWFIWQRRHPS